MNQIEDYIIVKNTISKELCQLLIDENNKLVGRHIYIIIKKMKKILTKQKN